MTLRRLFLFAACGWLPAAACAQEIQLGSDQTAPRTGRQRVELEADAVTVTAAHPEWVELRFRVDPGMHINSHAPHDELLVPTAMKWNTPEQVKVTREEYPAGIPLRLEIGDGETLSTYQGAFRVRVQVIAAKGESFLSGELHYQACDARSCFPPKNLPVRITVTAH